MSLKFQTVLFEFEKNVDSLKILQFSLKFKSTILLRAKILDSRFIYN